MFAKKALAASLSATAEKLYVEDVFSTYLYTGDGNTTQTITNGIDLSGEGGLVWIKRRDASATSHRLVDSARGTSKFLASELTNAEGTLATSWTFNSDGFATSSNGNGSTFASWTFRKAEKFFDVVTFSTTTSSTAPITVNHNLGSVPGCIIVKQTNGTADWFVYHRSRGSTKYLALNSTDMEQNGGTSKWYATPTSTSFTLGGDFIQNANYVAYLFAHDAGGFGDAGDQSVIKCGSFTTSGGAATVTLDWEPQWILVKASSIGEEWIVSDNMRGLVVGGNDPYLAPNSSNAESTTFNWITPTATGFSVANMSNATFIYIAIRRGPMKTPTSGTAVFAPVARTGTGSIVTVSNSMPYTDASLTLNRGGGTYNPFVDRLRGTGRYLTPNDTVAEITQTETAQFDLNNGVRWPASTSFGGSGNLSGNSYINYFFRRAPGFFDVVCYTGTGSANLSISHNLGVAPELMIIRRRNSTGAWNVGTQFTSSDFTYATIASVAPDRNASYNVGYGWYAQPTSSAFTLDTYSGTNASGGTYVAYLFASLSGVSKVGSYTGTGTTLQVNCGFTGGARFVLIKRTDSTGDWYVWDTARGIVSGNDPYLLLNSTAAEVTNTDYIDTYSSGFEISSTAPAAINANGGTFIYLTIA